MGIKKKLGLGAASAALGLSLIGGGTWAAFNDVENIDNSLKTGTLNVALSEGEEGVLQNFKLANLKPGDEFTRSFKLSNVGSLAIKEVWLDVLPSGFTNGNNEFVKKHGMTDNDYLDFLDQFAVELVRTGVEGGQLGAPFSIIDESHNVTLKNLVTGLGLPETGEYETDDATGAVTRINLAPTNTEQPEYNGLPADPRDYEIVEIRISMINNSSKVTDPKSKAFGEYYQNKYQGDSINLGFQFEATQWNGIMIEENGYVDENEQANPEPANEDEVTKP